MAKCMVALSESPIFRRKKHRIIPFANRGTALQALSPFRNIFMKHAATKPVSMRSPVEEERNSVRANGRGVYWAVMERVGAWITCQKFLAAGFGQVATANRPNLLVDYSND